MKRIEIRTVWAVVTAFALALTGTARARMHASPSPVGEPPQTSATTQQHTKLTAGERNFLQSAAEINATQVQIGQLAEKQSNDPNIQKIGQELAKDHSVALQQVEKLAASKGVSVTGQPTFLQQKLINLLQGKNGSAFNKQFLRQATLGHERAVSMFERASRRAQDPDVKSWASQMLPGLQDHLAMVKSGKPEAVAERAKDHRQPAQPAPSPGRSGEQNAPGKGAAPSGGY